MSIAFFDMDKTLLSRSSTTEYMKYLWRHQMLSVRELIAAVFVSAGYAVKLLDFPRVVALLSRDFRDGDVNETRALAERWVREELLRYIAPRAVARVRAQQLVHRRVVGAPFGGKRDGGHRRILGATRGR